MQINTITSKNSKKYKELKKLQKKKYRNELQLFVVENIKSIEDALKEKINPIEVFVSKAMFQEQKEFIEKISTENLYVLENDFLKEVSALSTPTGFLAVYKQEDKQISFDENILYLNGINDPGNLGTLLRTALAFSYKNIVLDKDCVDLYNPKVISSAKDAIFKLKIAKTADMALLENIKKEIPVLATSLETKDSLVDFTLKSPHCLVLGSEAHGISEEIKEISNHLLKINISGEMESLNVGVAGGIIMWKLGQK